MSLNLSLFPIAPQSSFVVLHTKEGAIIYAPDLNSIMRPLSERNLITKGLKHAMRVLALFVDSLYAHLPLASPANA